MTVGGLKSREALTRIEVLSRLSGFSYLAVFPETGRTHQIRVHAAAMGHPVVGDQVYGKSRGFPRKTPEEVRLAVQALPGFALHAHSLTFQHPAEKIPVTVTAPLPESFARVLQALGAST